MESGVSRASERRMSSSASLPPSRELFADDISCKIAPRGACYALLCSAARHGVPPSPPTLRAPVNLDGQWDSARWGMKEPPLSLFAEPELFPGFYELCGCQRTVVNINNLNLTLVQPHPPVAPNARLFQRARRGHGTFYNPEWHGKSNLMSDGGSGNGFKGSSNPSSLNTIVVGRRGVEHKALSPWEE